MDGRPYEMPRGSLGAEPQLGPRERERESEWEGERQRERERYQERERERRIERDIYIARDA